jgi:hypothetical protein
MIGEQEIERPRISTTASVQSYGRDSMNYAPDLDRSFVVSKEQIMGLENLNGYWKYGDAIVAFRIEPQDRPQRAHAFVARKSRPVRPPESPKHLPATTATGNGHDREQTSEIEVTPTEGDEVDTTF